MSRIYWETMIFIYWLEENPHFGKRVDAIWSRKQERKDELITGTLAFGEVFAGAYKQGAHPERIQRIRDALENALSAVIPFTVETAELYGRILRCSFRRRDSSGCAATAPTDLFLTNDRRLVGKIVPGIQFIASLDTQFF